METHSNLITDESQALELLYLGRDFSQIAFDTELVSRFNAKCKMLDVPEIRHELSHSQDFLIPREYAELDIIAHIAALVPADPGRQLRVAQELEMFEARNLLPVLRTLLYIVDTMKAHKIVWGVGRGSSVASYCLYLLGLHQVDSYKYDLDIREFLK